MDYLEIRLLKPLPKEIRLLSHKKDLIVKEEDVAMLNRAYDVKQTDRHRAKFSVSETYCSSEDMIDYIKKSCPERVKNYKDGTWSISLIGSSFGYDIQVQNNEGSIEGFSISKETANKLKREHISEKYFEITYATYMLDIGYRDRWLRDIKPTYVTRKYLETLLAHRIALSKEKSDEELEYDISDNGLMKPDIFGFIADCMKLGQRKGCRTWLSPVF